MQFDKHNFNYSMKNIPLINEKDYKPLLLDSISKFMTNLQWKANIFLHPEGFRNKKESYGFRTIRAPDPVPELQWLKDKMYDLAKNLEFRPYSNEFLKKLDKDIKEMNRNDQVYIKADKTSNFYKTSKETHDTLIEREVQKTHKKLDLA